MSVFIIAEAGINHNGKLALAMRLIEAARAAGADAVKFQAFNADVFSEPQRSICQPCQLSREEFLILHKHCERLQIEFMATPFDRQNVDFLEPLVRRFKIGSGQSMNRGFVEYIAAHGKPLIISTGMGYGRFVEAQYLHCVSLYPCPPEKANLSRMVTEQMDGYSDHTQGIGIPIAAVALGAKIIEKHITLDRNMKGPDHLASIEPDQFRAMVQGIRQVEAALV